MGNYFFYLYCLGVIIFFSVAIYFFFFKKEKIVVQEQRGVGKNYIVDGLLDSEKNSLTIKTNEKDRQAKFDIVADMIIHLDDLMAGKAYTVPTEFLKILPKVEPVVQPIASGVTTRNKEFYSSSFTSANSTPNLAEKESETIVPVIDVIKLITQKKVKDENN